MKLTLTTRHAINKQKPVSANKANAFVLQKIYLNIALLLIILTAGCASPCMKGTPFYSEEDNSMKDPDRIPLWPILYHQKDRGTSILWPLIEKTDNHFALRPVFSVYGFSEGHNVYNVAWPIARFDPNNNRYRIFPIFWGTDYFNIFPFYWHYGHPFGPEGGYDTLFPLWLLSRNQSGYNLYAPWPLIHIRNQHGITGWHVFPVAGNYPSPDGFYRFILWPLGHQWSTDNGQSSGSAFVPLYIRSQDNQAGYFLSLPYSAGHSRNGSKWRVVTPFYISINNADLKQSQNLLFPFYYRQESVDSSMLATLLGGFKRSDDNRTWFALPLLAAGKESQEGYNLWLFGPLVHRERNAENSTSSHIFPLYYKSHDNANKIFLSLPWSSYAATNGTSWQVIPFLFADIESMTSKTTITPLYAQGRHKNSKQWHAVMPLYYRMTGTNYSTTATLAGGIRSDSNGKKWLIHPLLSWGKQGQETGEFWLAAPFIHAKWDQDHLSHHFLPFYYWDDPNNTFISPLITMWNDNNGKSTFLLPWAISMLSKTPERKDLWLAAPLIHWSWGPNPGSVHIIPLIYANKQTDTLITPLFASWKGADDSNTKLIPPALSWLTSRKERSDLWLLGPTAHLSWGNKRGSQHLFPLFYNNKKSGTLVSPVITKWKKEETSHWLIPPLLSHYSTDGKNKQIDILALFHEEWSQTSRSGHFIPLYCHDGKKEIYTPLFGWNQKNKHNGFVYPLTPLLGIRTGDYYGGWLFPLFSYKRSKATKNYNGSFLWGGFKKQKDGGSSGIFPVYKYERNGRLTSLPINMQAYSEYGTTFISLPACWYGNTASLQPDPNKDGILKYTKRHGFFPLWRYSKDRIPAKKEYVTDWSLLMFLYDYKHESGKSESDQNKTVDKVRSRVLWYLWHYERLDKDISLDIFPAITYDKKSDGLKQISFLWRLFRYKKCNGRTEMDLLFLPIVRAGKPKETLAHRIQDNNTMLTINHADKE